MFDQEWVMEQLQKFFRAKLGTLPPEAKVALEKTRVTIARRPDAIEVAIDSKGDADVEKVKGLLLDGLVPTLSQVVGFFGCRVDVEPQSD